MNFAKIKSGIVPLDELFEGLYISQPTLLSGKRGSGTTTIALRFLSHLVRIGEKVLLFTDLPPAHVGSSAHGLGPDITPALESEQLSIVPYDAQLPLLPFPEALDELRDLVSERHYSYVVFDPVTPWLAAPADVLDVRLNSFFSVLSETSATTLLLLHKPVSKLARRLFDAVAERCTVCLSATRTTDGTHTLQVDKYMGEPPERCPAILHLATPAPGVSPANLLHAEMGSFGNGHSAPSASHAAPQVSASASASFFPVPPRPARPARPATPSFSASPEAAFNAPPAPKAPPPAAPRRAPAPPPAPRPAPKSAQSPADGGDIPFSRILRDEVPFCPNPSPRNATPPPAAPAAPRTIHFSDAALDDLRSPATPPPSPSPSPAPAPQPQQQPLPQPQQPQPPPPAETQPPQEHSIRFSDIIQ